MDRGQTAFLRAQPSSLAPILPVASPALSNAASFPLLTRGRGRASGLATGKIPSSSQWIRCPQSYNRDIPKRYLLSTLNPRLPQEGGEFQIRLAGC